MSAITSSILALLALSTPLVSGSVIARDTTPEVIPGPGLPSLADLNTTSAELFSQGPPASIEALSSNARVQDLARADFKPFCGGGNGDSAPVDQVIACFNYLTKLGHKNCVLPPNADQDVTFCQAGSAHIRGVNPTNHQASSYCSDVALGVQWVFTHCNTNGQVEGDQAANGNGDIIVVVGGPF